MKKILIEKENPSRLVKLIASFNGMFAEVIIIEIIDDHFDLTNQFFFSYFNAFFELFVRVLIYKGV